jgi:hypothetical protein
LAVRTTPSHRSARSPRDPVPCQAQAPKQPGTMCSMRSCDCDIENWQRVVKAERTIGRHARNPRPTPTICSTKCQRGLLRRAGNRIVRRVLDGMIGVEGQTATDLRQQAGLAPARRTLRAPSCKGHKRVPCLPPPIQVSGMLGLQMQCTPVTILSATCYSVSCTKASFFPSRSVKL